MTKTIQTTRTDTGAPVNVLIEYRGAPPKVVYFPRSTYRVWVVATGRNFGYTAKVTRNGRIVFETADVYATRETAADFALDYIETRESVTPGSLVES
jgi:hypothetical protein